MLLLPLERSRVPRLRLAVRRLLGRVGGSRRRRVVVVVVGKGGDD
jgi:hypothetical protein